MTSRPTRHTSSGSRMPGGPPGPFAVCGVPVSRSSPFGQAAGSLTLQVALTGLQRMARHHKVRTAQKSVDLEFSLADGAIFHGKIFVPIQTRLSDVLNDRRQFLPVKVQTVSYWRSQNHR